MSTGHCLEVSRRIGKSAIAPVITMRSADPASVDPTSDLGFEEAAMTLAAHPPRWCRAAAVGIAARQIVGAANGRDTSEFEQ